MEKNKKNWEKIFNKLKEFVDKKGNFPEKRESLQLYTWCAVQRLKHKKNKISREKIEKLDKIGFIWNMQDHVWKLNIEILKQYRKDFPDRWPSQRSKEPVEHKLAVWFLGIRKDYKMGRLTEERISDLKSIGFPFYPREYRWNINYEKLNRYIIEKKSFPQRGSKDKNEEKLFNWCRYQAKKMQINVLEEYQVKK